MPCLNLCLMYQWWSLICHGESHYFALKIRVDCVSTPNSKVSIADLGEYVQGQS